MSKKKNIVEVGLGLFILTVALGFGWNIYKNKLSPSSESILLKAEFDSISGLSKGAPVKINGVIVGDVKNIVLNPKKNYSAVVTFSIDKSYHLPKDSQAAIVTESLMGSKIMSLSPGHTPELLKENDIIYDTLSSMNLEDMIQKFLFNSVSDSKNNELLDSKVH